MLSVEVRGGHGAYSFPSPQMMRALRLSGSSRHDHRGGYCCPKHRPVCQARLDPQRATQSLEPVLHVGQPGTA